MYIHQSCFSMDTDLMFDFNYSQILESSLWFCFDFIELFFKVSVKSF